jgi:cytochrome c oxidase subunit 2
MMDVSSQSDLGGLVLGSGLMDWWTRLSFRGPGASTISPHSDWLFFWIFVISAIFFVILMALMVYFTFKYRRRPGARPVRSASHNTLMELSWSVIPTILLVWMFFEGFWGYADVVVAPAEAPEMVLEAKKWSWSITYPNGAASPEVTRTRAMAGEAGGAEGATDTPIFVMPEKQPIRVRMASIDVIHSFWIPDFRAKFDVFPNRYTSLWFETTGIKGDAKLPSEGGWKKWAGAPYEDHWVFCAEYCGSNHSEMSAIIRVVPQDVYQDIVTTWAKPTGTPVQIGAFYYKSKGCNSCHTVDGKPLVGPSWKNMYGHAVEFSDGSSLSDEQMTGEGFANYVRQSILDPGAKIVKGFPNQMQTYQGKINNEEMEAIMAYMKSLSDKAPPELAAPAAEPKK